MLLVSSCRHPGRWIVPSGGVEPGEESSEAAIREVEEEVSNVRTRAFFFTHKLVQPNKRVRFVSL